MSDFNKILWGFVFSAIGIIFGWTLNQLGQWFRARQDDKKNLKVVLFNLLETYFIFLRSDLDKFVRKVTDKVHERIPKEHQTLEAKKEIHKVYSEILTLYLQPQLQGELKALHIEYQNSIGKLAAIDPLTAFYLSGKTNALQLFDTIAVWFEDIKKHHPNEKEAIAKGSDQALEAIKPDIYKRTMDELEDDIRTIAWKINPYTWLQSKRELKRLKWNANIRIDQEIDKLFGQVEHFFGK